MNRSKLGRSISERKGSERRTGATVVTGGGGVRRRDSGYSACEDGPDLKLEPKVKYVGLGIMV